MVLWSQVAEKTHGLALIDPVAIGLGALLILAAPAVLWWTRSILAGALTIALSAYPVWIYLESVLQAASALWIAITWLTLCLAQIQTVAYRRSTLNTQDILDRVNELEYRIDVFLDALDRRASITKERSWARASGLPRDRQAGEMRKSVS